MNIKCNNNNKKKKMQRRKESSARVRQDSFKQGRLCLIQSFIIYNQQNYLLLVAVPLYLFHLDCPGKNDVNRHRQI